MRTWVLHRGAALRARSARRSGVSLLVVLCSLFLVGLAAVIAIPAYFARHDVTLDNACRLLARDIRSLQNRAALDKVGVRVVFDRDGWRALNTSGELVSGVGESHPVDRRLSKDGVFSGVCIERFEFGADNALGIDTRGLTTERGFLVIAFGEERRSIEIERGAGEVIVESMANAPATAARNALVK